MVLRVESILWRNLTGGDFFHIEKDIPEGPKGQLHIDLAPGQPVDDFLGETKGGETVELEGVRTIGAPEVKGKLEFKKRPTGRWGLPRQNPKGNNSARHPAWTETYGWPDYENSPRSTAGGQKILDQAEGVHIYVVKTSDGEYYAGMTTGNTLPQKWPASLKPLFEPQEKSTGCIFPSTTSDSLSPLAAKIVNSLADRKNVLLYGPPGTGKTHAVSEIYRFLKGHEGAQAQALTLDPHNAQQPFSETEVESPLPGPTRADWTTFHQDFGYEDFVIGLRPTGEGLALEPAAGRLLDIAADVSDPASGFASGLLVLDEINRGNVPRILGDFLTFMDDEYREGGNNSIQVSLPRIKNDINDPLRTEPIRMLDGTATSLPVPWYFPAEVYLLATMNSVDKAIAPLDSAIGRRFERIDAMPDLRFLSDHLSVDFDEVMYFIESKSENNDRHKQMTRLRVSQLRNEPSLDTEEDYFQGSSATELGGETELSADALEEEEKLYRAIEWTPKFAAVCLLNYLNSQIADRLGPDFELGHVYFLNVESWQGLAVVWDRQIYPQLRDRFGARPHHIVEILRVGEENQPASYPFILRNTGSDIPQINKIEPIPPTQLPDIFDYLCFGFK